MRLPFRRKDKERKKSGVDVPDEFLTHHQGPLFLYPPTYRSAQLVDILPPAVLQRIFYYVCPHSGDESYETCEGSTVDSVCMLCDLRDLSRCNLVCKAWRKAAVPVLYHSVRIDPVHYCRLEAILAERRKKSRFDRNAIPEDPAQARLRLLRRSVREDPTRLGRMVQFLKTPYMLRESCHVELAQTIAVLPNLQYVDLPEGMFSDDPSFTTLRLEVQARCPNLRKMTYNRGAERSLSDLATGRVWTQLEVLELDGIHIDPLMLRNVLASLSNLRAFKVSNTDSLTDEVLICDDGMPSLPPVEELVLKDTPHVTVNGMLSYLAWQETQQALKVLNLINTGVHPSCAQEILLRASKLKTLAFQTMVSDAFPNGAGVRPMASRSLETLRFEISGPSRTGPYSALETGYYSYLASSILGGGLPRLRRLYVLDDTMPVQLQGLVPPSAAFSSNRSRSRSFTASTTSPLVPSFQIGSGGPTSPGLSPPPQQRRPLSNITPPAQNRLSSNNPFAGYGNKGPSALPTHTLEVFTKSDELGRWNFAKVDSSAYMGSGAGDSSRPGSMYGLGAELAGPGWDAGEARRSVMVGNGTGAFLAVPGKPENPFGGYDGMGPSDSWRPKSSGGDSVKSTRDLWR